MLCDNIVCGCLQRVVWCVFFFFNDTATTEIYTLSLHDALPISKMLLRAKRATADLYYVKDNNRNNITLIISCLVMCILLTRSEEHTSELQSPVPISYAVFCLKKKKHHPIHTVSKSTIQYLYFISCNVDTGSITHSMKMVTEPSIHVFVYYPLITNAQVNR